MNIVAQAHSHSIRRWIVVAVDRDGGVLIGSQRFDRYDGDQSQPRIAVLAQRRRRLGRVRGSQNPLTSKVRGNSRVQSAMPVYPKQR